MIDTYKYEKLNWYPHMKPNDVAIWNRFIEKYPDAYVHCQYDFWVGSPPPFSPIVTEDNQGSADGLYRKKIDVVAYRDDDIHIIELKPKAGLAAIGQVKGYVYLFERDEKPKKKPQPVIITDEASIDVREIAAKEGVLLIEV